MVYVDTSALAKRYLQEEGSDDVDSLLDTWTSVAISRLTMVELRCLLARRRRNHEIDPAIERRSLAAFEEDVARGFFEMHPLEDRHAIGAHDLLIRLAAIPLRTLDALHLSIATSIEADTIATADRVLADAASSLKFKVERFGTARIERRRH